MLRLLLGPVRSGKTAAVFSAVRDGLEKGRRALLIVPEQTSFAYEKRVADLGREGAEALGFTRLAERILEEQGKSTGPRLTETAACFLMYAALGEIGEELEVYGSQRRSRGFLERVLAFAGECVNAGIGPGDLSNFAFSLPPGTLRGKTADLALILDAYLAVLSRSGVTESDLLRDAADCLEGYEGLRDTDVYLESFSDFTAPQYAMIEALLRRCPRVTVSLIGDGESPAPPAFAVTRHTADRLAALAERVGASVEKTVLPEMPGTPFAPLLRALRDDLLPQEGEKDPRVTVFRAADPAAEAQKAAAMIARLTREEGCRCRDVAVVMRSDGDYRAVLPAAMEVCGVSFFYDTRAAARSGALLRGVADAVLCAAGDRRGDPCHVLKSPLLGLPEEDADETENYCFVWQVRPREWSAPFTRSPAGLKEGGLGEEDQKLLERIENCRKRVAEPLEKLRAAVNSGSGEAFARGVWQYLQDVGAAGNLTRFAEGMEDVPRREFLQQQSLLWDSLTEVLDLFAGLPGELELPPDRIAELFELALSCARVATPPRTLDQVTVGTADRMRIDDAKIIFLLGAVQGKFPDTSSGTGLLTDAELTELRTRGGFDLLDDPDRQAGMEQLLLYTVAAAAGERLIVSMPAALTAGETCEPSSLYRAAAAVALPEDPPAFWEAVTPEAALRAYAAAPENSGEKATLRRALELAGWGERAERVDRAARREPHRIKDKALAARLFGDRMRISATRLERYYGCPYADFAASGMGVRPLRRAELSASVSGTLLHRVLERVLRRHPGEELAGLSQENLQKEISGEIEAYLEEVLGKDARVPRRMKARLDRLARQLLELLEHLGKELAQSGFRPAAFELTVGEGPQVGTEGLAVITEDGCEARVTGKVDRVDVAEAGGRRLLRVVDYKSGEKTVDLTEVYYGLDLQMLLYLFSLRKNGKGELAGAVPAGVLYMPLMNVYHTVSSRKEAEELLEHPLPRHRMTGLLLRDDGVLQAMEPGPGEEYVLKKETAGNVLASAKEMERLGRLVEERLLSMARSLRGGEIPALPAVKKNGRRPCDYCDFKRVCGWEPGDPDRELTPRTRAEVLGEEEDHGEDQSDAGSAKGR